MLSTIVIALLIGFFGLQALAWVRSKRLVGKPAPDTSAIDGTSEASTRRLYYFHSQHCGPCRSVTPMVERIRAEHPNVIPVDVAQNIELSRSFSVAGTPSFVLVESGRVKEVLLGVQSERKLLSLIEG